MTVRVLEVVRETPTQCTVRLDWSPVALPGQFVMVWLPGVDEVPMALSIINGAAGITVQRVGEATEALCGLSSGAMVGVRGPLGRGFTLQAGERHLLVGGGNGTASLAPLARVLIGRGAEVHVAIGAKTADELLFEERFEGMGCASVNLATDDGTKGFHGFASNLAEELMDAHGPDMVCTCGPELMMRKVAEACWERDLPVEASLERFMKCAVGLCDACAFGPFLVCRDGPVFDSQQLRSVEDFGRFRRGASGTKEPL
jgi:dihydroorotate dehydrogenase electron transfer subunit